MIEWKNEKLKTNFNLFWCQTNLWQIYTKSNLPYRKVSWNSWVSEYTFLSSKNKKQQQKTRIKKSKRSKWRKEISPVKKFEKNCGRPGEDFSRHPHFRKQEYYIFWPCWLRASGCFFLPGWTASTSEKEK